MKRRKGLRPVSSRRAEENNLYYHKRNEFLSKNRWCEAGIILDTARYTTGCTLSSTQVHHRKKRRKYFLDETTWIPVCVRCHTFIEDHKDIARELGLLANIHDC